MMQILIPSQLMLVGLYMVPLWVYCIAMMEDEAPPPTIPTINSLPAKRQYTPYTVPKSTIVTA